MFIEALNELLETNKTDDELVDKHEANFAILGWLRIYWSTAWREFAESNKYILSARYVLIQDEFSLEKNTSSELALEELMEDLKHILPKAEKELVSALPADD